jgi:predicted RNA binding protein YcfA (HicA-like mRNA interferase family)
MKIPRDLTGVELAKLLRKFGYQISRQKGSHIRLTTEQPSEYHITIPNHDPLKIGTLSSILSDVAEHQSLSKEELMKELF